MGASGIWVRGLDKKIHTPTSCDEEDASCMGIYECAPVLHTESSWCSGDETRESLQISNLSALTSSWNYMQIKPTECFKEMEIPSAGISWLYTAGFTSSSVDMEKNMSSCSPYGNCDVGRGRKQSYSPCSMATAWLCPGQRQENSPIKNSCPVIAWRIMWARVCTQQAIWKMLSGDAGRDGGIKLSHVKANCSMTLALAVCSFLT